MILLDAGCCFPAPHAASNTMLTSINFSSPGVSRCIFGSLMRHLTGASRPEPQEEVGCIEARSRQQVGGEGGMKDGLFAGVLRLCGFDSGVVVTRDGWMMPPSLRRVV